ncbi:carbon-nitrogen family hydrolase [Streptomyces candidus]|uniref:Putative amidohydrolase n=1 Tax=Streptomyces candidus TaxID=67283 RepID=A0A7X0HJM0_9ACTN|nr:carbon-nitrogen family hydrolase [Streptomyces candidus]MBB6437378.1 putative amidohydrolase [Streptomyces candidus]GHH38798.1 hydrolase [Streptomyces candidus]
MRASLLQIDVNEDESANSRRERVASLVRAQQDSDLVVLPELWPTGAWAYEGFADEAEPLEGPTYEVMAKAARDAGVWLHAGSFVERDPEGPLYNTSLVFSPDGSLVAAYRKIHRFGFDGGEAVLLGAGQELVTVPMPGLRLGLATCYDLRFPELFRGLVDAGADAFVLPAGWPARRRGHWTLLARARAVENQAYVLACGTAGTHAGVEQAGHSIVVDPWGEVLAEAGTGEEVLVVDLDPALPGDTREKFPVLKDRLLGFPAPRR